MVLKVSIFTGGTGASTAVDARENLGLGVNSLVTINSANANTFTANAMFIGSAAVATIDDVLALSIVLGS